MNLRKKTVVMISSIFLLLTVCVLLFAGMVLYNNSIEENSKNGFMALRTSERMINKEILMKSIELGDEYDEEYLSVMEQLTEVAESNELLYLYTAYLDDENNLTYGIVADSYGDGTLGLTIDEDDITEEMLNTINNGVETYTKPEDSE